MSICQMCGRNHVHNKILSICIVAAMMLLSACHTNDSSVPTTSQADFSSEMIEITCEISEETLPNRSPALFQELSEYLSKKSCAAFIEANPIQGNCIILDSYFLSIDHSTNLILGNKSGELYQLNEISDISSIGLLSDHRVLIVQNTEKETNYFVWDLLSGKLQQIFDGAYQRGELYELESQQLIVMNGCLYLHRYRYIEDREADYIGLSDPLMWSDLYEYQNDEFTILLSDAGDLSITQEGLIYCDIDYQLKRFSLKDKKTVEIDLSKVLPEYRSTAIYADQYMVLQDQNGNRISLDLTNGKEVVFAKQKDIFLTRICKGGNTYYGEDISNQQLRAVDLSTGKVESLIQFSNADEIRTIRAYDKGLLIEVRVSSSDRSCTQFYYYDGQCVTKIA